MELIKQYLNDSADVKRQVADTLSEEISRAIEMAHQSLRNNGKILLMGNGGSAGDAQHIAAEFVGRYKDDRKALPAIALSVDTSALTCIGNDYGFEMIFERQIDALCRSNDVVIGFSTSGNSENIIRGIKRAKEIGAGTISLLGKKGGRAKDLADVTVIVPSDDTARIQETHITIGHILCEIIEQKLIHENKI